jgi:exodeoxyribonuclease VII large subunit
MTPSPMQRRAPVAVEGDLPTPAPRSAREEEAQVLSVADLDRRLKRVIEGSTENVRVAGEVSSLKEVPSGHIYFTLKDEEEEAAIDCVMYRTAAPRGRRVLEDGARVVVQGRATLYVPRGRLQLTVDSAQLAGRGALLEALEKLKEKLAAEGLFETARKRALPRDAKVIGVVTSASGAAIHDILKVAFQRGAVRIVLAAAPVQGREAAPKMARALAALGRMREVEAIIVGRGGGSADDLSAFNEEVLVREAAKCRVPVVSAVGHEVDISLLDLVADARAATPSQAAEMLVPDAAARRAELAHLAQRMRRALVQKIERGRTELERREGRLQAFPRSVAERQQWVDDALGRLEKEMGRRLAQRRTALAAADRVLWSRHPRAVLAAARSAIEPLAQRLAPAAAARIAGARRDVEGLQDRLGRALPRRLDGERASLAKAAGRLDALSPLAVLARGYAIATVDGGRAVRSAREVAAGDRVRVRVHDGAILTEVISTEPGTERGEER